MRILLRRFQRSMRLGSEGEFCHDAHPLLLIRENVTRTCSSNDEARNTRLFNPESLGDLPRNLCPSSTPHHRFFLAHKLTSPLSQSTMEFVSLLSALLILLPLVRTVASFIAVLLKTCSPKSSTTPAQTYVSQTIPERIPELRIPHSKRKP